MRKLNLASLTAMAMAMADQYAAKSRDWSAKLPDHFRAGDVVIVFPDGIKSAPSYVWLLVKQHPSNSQLWYGAIADDRNSLLGRSDLHFEGAVYDRVVRPTIGTWLHEDDLLLKNRVDHATENVVSHCIEWIGKATPELHEEDGDGYYLEHIEDARHWEHIVTECLHSELTEEEIQAAEKGYWKSLNI